MKNIFTFATLSAVLVSLIAAPFAQATYGDVTTFSGSPYSGDGGAAVDALLDFAEDVVSDDNTSLYIADTFNNAIRKVTSGGIISTLAGGSYGFTNGTGTAAEFALPRGLAIDGSGNVYVADTENNAIRKITPSGVVTTLVSSGLSAPYGVAVAGSTVFIADTGNDALKSVSTSGGTVTTITSSLSEPKKIAAKANGSVVYVADTGSHRVLAVTVSGGAVSVLAGSGNDAYEEGTGTGASFEHILGLALSDDENTLYVSDIDLYLTDRIRTINIATGATSLFTSESNQQTMIFPAGLSVEDGYLFVAMSGLGTIRRYNVSDASVSSVVAGSDRFGSTEGSAPQFGRPHDMAMTSDGSSIYLAENNRVRKLNAATGASSYIIGSEVDNYRDGIPVADGVPNSQQARFSTVAGIVVNSDQTAVYVTDRWNNRIRKVDLTASPKVTSLVTGAGRINGTGDTTNAYQEGTKCTQVVDRNDPLTTQAGCAYFEKPTGIVMDPSEQYLYVADSGNHRIRKVTIATGQTSLIAGSTAGYTNGQGSSARFNTPWGLALNEEGTILYVADRNNHRIRKIDLSNNMVTTVAGAGTAGYQEGIGSNAFFSFPLYLKMGADANLYLSDTGSHRIRQINPSTGLTKLVAGSGNRGYVNGAKASAEFNGLEGLVPDTANGKLYAADSSNDTIRLVDVQGTAPYSDPAPTVTSVEPSEVDRDWDQGAGLNVAIIGTGFRHGAVAKFYTYSATTYVISSTKVVATLPLSSMSAGWYDVTVTNSDGQSDVLEAGLGLRAADDSIPDVFYSVADASGFYAYASTIRGGYNVASGNVWGDQKDEIITGTGNGMAPQVRIFSQDGSVRGQFFAYSSSLRTGVRVATCDLNGDGGEEIITVPGPGARPHVRILNRAGEAVINTGFFALDGQFKGGAHVACGDVTGDGVPEILVSASKGGGPHVTIHKVNGDIVGNFFAYAASFRGGITLDVIDLDGNGTKEVVTGPEVGAPHVQIFGLNGRRLSPGFFAFSPGFRGGIDVAGGDTNGDTRDEIVVTPRADAQVRVKVYNTNGDVIHGTFLAFPRQFTGGGVVASGDVDGNGVDDIITMPASNFAPSVRMFSQDGSILE